MRSTLNISLLSIILLPVIKNKITLFPLSLSFVVTSIILLNHPLTNAQPVETVPKFVHAGQGNASDIVFAFIPQKMTIKVGESITWDNPNFYAEPHSVTFLNEAEYFPEFIVQFNFTKSTEFLPSDPNTYADPMFVPDVQSQTSNTVMMINARAFTPVVIDSSGRNVTYLQPNSNYNMIGGERLVNSGWLWPEGQAPPGGSPISNFTITFKKPGIYSYLCNVHPWMSGSVTVE